METVCYFRTHKLKKVLKSQEKVTNEARNKLEEEKEKDCWKFSVGPFCMYLV